MARKRPIATTSSQLGQNPDPLSPSKRKSTRPRAPHAAARAAVLSGDSSSTGNPPVLAPGARPSASAAAALQHVDTSRLRPGKGRLPRFYPVKLYLEATLVGPVVGYRYTPELARARFGDTRCCDLCGQHRKPSQVSLYRLAFPGRTPPLPVLVCCGACVRFLRDTTSWETVYRRMAQLMALVVRLSSGQALRPHMQNSSIRIQRAAQMMEDEVTNGQTALVLPHIAPEGYESRAVPPDGEGSHLHRRGGDGTGERPGDGTGATGDVLWDDDVDGEESA